MNDAMMLFTADLKKQHTGLFSFHNILNHVPCYKSGSGSTHLLSATVMLRSFFTFCSCWWSCKIGYFSMKTHHVTESSLDQNCFRVHFEFFRGLVRRVLYFFRDWDERVEVEISIYTENPANPNSDIWTAIRAVYFQHVSWCLPPMWR